MKKTISMLLVLVMLTAVLASCAVGGGKPAETTEPVPETPTLPETRYDGYEFNVLVTGNMNRNDFFAEESNTDIVSNAVYRKNATVESKYGITIKSENRCSFGSTSGAGPGYAAFSQAYMSGSFDYDMGMIGAYDAGTLAYSGYLTDLATLPYINLAASWWDAKAVEQLSVGGKTYFTTGEISLSDNVFTTCIIFNKGIVAENGALENPYELVRSNKWTFETLGTEVKKVSEDINGDHVFDENDRYGLLTWNDAILAALNAGGGYICKTDDYGEISLTLNSEANLAVLSAYCDILFDDSAINYQFITKTVSKWDPMRTAIFDEDRALYYMSTFNTVPKHRDMATDFGIIPYPKYSEAQTDYGHLVNAYHTQFLCVPFYIENEERTGVIIEDTAYISQKIMTPAYYEKTLVGTLIRDDESAEMLDLIFASHVYDIGMLYRIGGYMDVLMQIPKTKTMDTFASAYAAKEASARNEIEEINAKFGSAVAGDKQ